MRIKRRESRKWKQQSKYCHYRLYFL